MCTIHISSQSLQTPLPHRILTIFLLSLGRSRLSATPLSLHNSITSIQAHNVTPPSFNVTKAYSAPASGEGNKSDPQIFQNDYSNNCKRKKEDMLQFGLPWWCQTCLLFRVFTQIRTVVGEATQALWALARWGRHGRSAIALFKYLEKHVEPHAAARLNTFVSG